MNKRFGILAVLVIGAGALLGGLLGRVPAKATAGEVTPEAVVADYRTAMALVEDGYAGKLDLERVTDTSIQGMLWSLDPHSSFFNREELKKLDEEQASQFYGIGVSIFQHRDGVYVQSVLPGTPAEKAGMRYGDRFIEIDGKDAREWSSSEVSKNVRGEKGTVVKVKIDRAASDAPISFEITRGGVPLPSVRNYFMLPNSVGYVGLTGGFQQTTSDELKAAIADLKKQGLKSLILDLRGNPGGILEQAVAVVSQFIPAGKTVVSVKASRFEQNRELRSKGNDPNAFPLVVLINGGSASASEIVAGAIQDYDRGIVVGSESFGKGLVQRVFRLPYGTGLTLTTARYYTPFGRSLQRDYSHSSIYEYYSHNSDGDDPDFETPKPEGVPVTTANGRVLYGGRGIEPDVAVDRPKNGELRSRINEAAFFFTRLLVAGKVAGLENYKNDKQNFKQSIQASEIQITERVFEAFRQFAASDPANGLKQENLQALADYARGRLRQELATADYSYEAGLQVQIENDPQVLKATQSMAEAAKLVEIALMRPISR